MANIEKWRAWLWCACACTCMSTTAAFAQVQAQGFAVERLVLSAPGNNWVSMDDLQLDGGLGGALSLTLGYANSPLRITSADGAETLAVVEHQAFANLGLAVTYDRFRFHLALSSPLAVTGQSGAVDGAQFTAPSVNLEHNPDSLADAQLGLDARLWGAVDGPLRLGASATLIAPSGARSTYLTDDTWRAMGRVLLAGDAGMISYAGDIGVHIRPLDDASVPQSPQGSELLFGIAGAIKLPGLEQSIQIGPEIFGATALRACFGGDTTALEGLLTARFDGSRFGAGRLRIKAGLGAGLNPEFGAPRWRAVLGLELVGGR